LFGITSGANITGVRLYDAQINAASFAGALVGEAKQGTSITNSYTTGEITSTGANIAIGGLAGRLASVSHINECMSEVTVTASSSNQVGGLVGHNHKATITNAYARENVSGSDMVGGLVGHNQGGTIRYAYATGHITHATDNAGGDTHQGMDNRPSLNIATGIRKPQGNKPQPDLTLTMD